MVGRKRNGEQYEENEDCCTLSFRVQVLGHQTSCVCVFMSMCFEGVWEMVLVFAFFDLESSSTK